MPGPGSVVEFAGVGVRRGRTHLLEDVDWTVAEGERWVVVGPNGAGKTTLLSVAATLLHPSSGMAAVLGEVLGATDVFELRPRIGLASAALADRIPPAEVVGDIVVTASWAVYGRGRERYDAADAVRAMEVLDQVGAAGPAAGLDLGAREDLVATLGLLVADPRAPALVLVTHHLEEIPPGVTHAMVLRGGRVTAAGPVGAVLTGEVLGDAFGLPLAVGVADGRWSARAR